MDYNNGRMGMSEGIALAFIVTFPTIFLSAPSSEVAMAGSVAWLARILAGFIAGTLLFMLTYVFTRYPGDLLSVTEKLLGRFAAYSVGLFYFLALFSLASLWTREFAENTILAALPYADFSFLIACYILSAGCLLFVSIENVCRATYLLLPFMIGTLLLVWVGNLSLYRPYNLFPWQGNGLSSLIQPILMALGSSVSLFILTLLAPAFQSVKTIKGAVIFGYGGSVVLRFISVGAFIMLFGTNVAMEKRLPFYEMARLIYLNRYLQRFEAVFILMWVMVGILAIAISLYGALFITAKLFKLPSIKPLLPVMTLIIGQIALMPPDSQGVIVMETILYTYVLAPGVIMIPTLLFITAIIKGGKK